jgi:hypothetical protein
MNIADFTDVNSVTFGDWQRDYLYKLLVTKEPIDPAFTASKGGIDKDQIDAYCDAAPLPNSKQNVLKRMWAGKWYNVSSKLDSANTVQLTFRVDEHNLVLKYLSAWHNLSGSDATAASLPKAMYIGEIALLLYKTDKVSVGSGYSLKNAWISEFSDITLDKAKDGIITITVTIAYDKRVPYSA